MTHSIPDAVGLAIRTPVGTVVHTGDFKIDQTPLDGRLPDLGRLAELGGRGRAAPHVRLDERRARRRDAVGAHGRHAARGDLPRGDGPRRRHDVLVAHPPHAAGDRPRRCASGGKVGARRAEPHVAHRASRATSGCCTCPTARSSTSASRATCRASEVALLTAGSQAEAASALVRIAMDAHQQVTPRAGRHGRAVVAHHSRERARRSRAW